MISGNKIASKKKKNGIIFMVSAIQRGVAHFPLFIGNNDENINV